MPFSGSGTWTNVYNWVNDAAAGIKILASRQQTQWDDIANNGLSNVICKDGQSTITANIPFSGFKATGLGAPTVAGDALRWEDGTFTPTDASGAGLALTVVRASYSKLGSRYLVDLVVTYPATADGSNAKIGLGTLPAFANVTGVGASWFVYDSLLAGSVGTAVANTNTFGIAGFNGGAITNSQLSTAQLRMQFQLCTV